MYLDSTTCWRAKESNRLASIFTRSADCSPAAAKREALSSLTDRRWKFPDYRILALADWISIDLWLIYQTIAGRLESGQCGAGESGGDHMKFAL